MNATAKPTVSVVDDADDVRELTALQLRLFGYDVLEATRLLRNVKELCHVSMVAFSAFGSGCNRRIALDAGCDEYITKTAGISQLLEIVRRHLSAA